jgi:hypothetical protein
VAFPAWILCVGCCLTALPPAVPAAAEEAAAGEVILTGTLTREEIEAAMPEWVGLAMEAEIDRRAAQALAAVPEGARVTVYLGTWCSDSRREISRLWRALDEIGYEAGSGLPFELEYIGVDRDKREPGGRAVAAEVLYVPTFVVQRQGKEVGRIVEESPRSIEEDLLALLQGDEAGVLTGSRSELLEVGAGTPEG